MNDKKPLVDFRSAPKLQTSLMLSGALIGFFGAQGGITVLTVLGIVLILASGAVWSLYYRCPHCGEQLGRDRYLKYCPHCGRALDAPLDAPVRTLSVPAYAKLNLTLDILGKRPDGYHEMKMVMQTISLHDDVTVTLTDKGITCRVADAALPCDERNLAVKAAKAFCEAVNYFGGIDIALTKRIPSEAGMAGGSADAAAVLRALRDLVSPALTDERLEQIGAAVGSDVPFCIRGGTQLAEGRGEVLTVLPPAPKCFAAVCKPDFPISTPALFARVDGVTLSDRPDTDAMLSAIEGGNADALCKNVSNVFEQALPEAQRQRIEEIKRALTEHGALCAAMTGSGSAVFGLFREEDACQSACRALQSERVMTFCTEFV